MKIKNVEELVGITRKNIRFYEDQGLLSPDRAENGYREYDQKDITQLMKIKLFRKLGIPIEEIKNLFAGSITVYDCLDRNLDRLDKEKENLNQIQDVSRQIMLKHSNLSDLNIEEFLEEIERLEKGGTNFMELEKTDTHKKKRIGAIGSTAVILLIIGLYIGFILWAMKSDSAPIGIVVVVLGVGAIIAIGVIAALISRMKEIKGGEEDEASKY